jgi:quinoprotein glucose dehydrogenase
MIRFLFLTVALTASLFAGTKVFQKFEGDGYDGWQSEGAAFGLAPLTGKTSEMDASFMAYANDSLAASVHGGYAAKGTLTSPLFRIDEPYITFLVAGGDVAGKTAVQLVIDNKVVREAVGKRKLRMEPALWDVSEFLGRSGVIRLIDQEEGDWGMIAADHVIFADKPNQKFPTTTRGGKAFVEGLEPAVGMAGVNIPIGSKMSVEATYEEHKLTSPTALTFDEQGRVYLSETHRFRQGVEDDRDRLYWYLDDLAAKKTRDRRALHEKWKDKLPLEELTKRSEVIRRLADTDGDGKIDESKVFADGFNDVLDGTAAGVFFYEGSLYFACIPKIWALRDTDGDGTADERKVVEDGFGVRVSLSGHDLNGFTLGPDGRIYGTVGDRGFSVLTQAGVTYDFPNEGAAFRFEPDGTGFEVFHTGLRNPKEIAFDALGNAFSVDNNSDQGDAARVVYLVEGGDSGWQMEHQTMHSFHRQIGLEDRPPGRWMEERMWELENPSQPAYILPPIAHLTSGPSGLTYHPGAGFLEAEAGRFLVCDYRGGAANSGVWSFEIKPKGAGMMLSDSRQFAWGIAATDVEYSWDGRVFISDFINGWASHEAGRLLALDAGEKIYQARDAASTPKLIREGFDSRSSAELANLLKHPDLRVRLRSQLALTRKPDAVQRLMDAADSSNFSVRMHGIWGLGIVSRRGSAPLPGAAFGNVPTIESRRKAEGKLVSLLKDKNAEVRAQVLRVLADAGGDASLIPLGPLLGDESPRVRFFAALLVGKRKMIGYYGPVCDLLEENNNQDVHLRHAGIFALQHLAENPSILTALSFHDSAAVRLAAAVALRRMKHPGLALFVRDRDPQVADEAIRAICDLDLEEQRGAVGVLLDQVGTRSWTPFMLRRLVHNAYRIGNAENAARILQVAGNPEIPEIVRKEAFRLLNEWTEPFPADQLTGHWRPLDKRDLETIRPALMEAVPALLQQEGFVLTEVLGLVERHDLKVQGLDDEALAVMVRNGKLSAPARSAALRLLIEHEPADLAAFLTELAADPSDQVAVAALAGLAKLSPEVALPSLEAAATSENPRLAQKAWPILAALSGGGVDAIFEKNLAQLEASKGVSLYAIELLEAAKKRTAPSVKTAIAAYEKSLVQSGDPYAEWNSTLEGGDPSAGAALFSSHPASECMRCHRAEEGHAAGGETAPNLAGIAKRHQDRRYFLESMIAPSAVIAPGFGAVWVELKNGASLTGNLMAETTEHLDIDAAGKPVRVLRSDIASFTPPVSAMPSMKELLSAREMRDLVAWMASLDQGGDDTKPFAEPVLLDLKAMDVAAPPVPAGEGAVIDPAVLKTGMQQYLVCGACHGQGGEGTAAGPPLAGSEWVNGPQENLIRIQLRGLKGPIVVKGKEYHFPAGMAPMAYQTDDQIAAVLTYVRNSFGNSAPPVDPAAVAALRGEVGKPPVTAEELLPPVPGKESKTEPVDDGSAPAKATGGKYDDLESSASGFPVWLGVIGGLMAAGLLGMLLRKK